MFFNKIIFYSLNNEILTWNEISNNGTKFQYASFIGGCGMITETGAVCDEVFPNCPTNVRDFVKDVLRRFKEREFNPR